MHCNICGKRSIKDIREIKFEVCLHSIDLCSICSKNFKARPKCTLCQMSDDIKESEEEEAVAEAEIRKQEKEKAVIAPVSSVSMQKFLPPANANSETSLICSGDAVKFRNDPESPIGAVVEVFPMVSEAIVAWPGNGGLGLIKKIEGLKTLERIDRKGMN